MNDPISIQRTVSSVVQYFKYKYLKYYNIYFTSIYVLVFKRLCGVGILKRILKYFNKVFSILQILSKYFQNIFLILG